MVEAERPSADLEELAERVAAHPHGLGFLHLADAETVAVTLGVSPFVVTEARERLETEEGRKLMIDMVKKAREMLRERKGTTMAERFGETRPRWVREPPPPKSPEEVIEEAKRHEFGLPFLEEAPVETVAITFEVHPEIVLRARELLGRERGNAKTDG